ncbi:MAG: carbon-nitrogen hydrolase family protein [Pseudomonadota bacterium]
MTKIAVLQMTSGIDPEANFAHIKQAARDAKAGGADILFTPEMALLLDRDRKRARAALEVPAYSEYHDCFCALAETFEIDIALGSMPYPLEGGLLANRSFYFRADGEDPRYYDKIHMFDVELSTGERWRESTAYKPGEHLFIESDTPLLSIGFTICYDLRFPALFEELGRHRCDAIAVPAAFTVPTGKAHWHVLLRARAIEASAFVIAAAQVGKHEDGRETYGHSLVVDPWGEVLLDMGGEEPGLGFCDIDLKRIAEVRSQIPSLANKREIPKYPHDDCF